MSNEMNEAKAREILGEDFLINNDDALDSAGPNYLCAVVPSEAVLDGDFSLKELQAIVWWMENKL